MSPHQRMEELDHAGDSYVVQLGNSGQERSVFSHSEQWLQISSDDQREWVNLRHIATIRIIEQ